MTGDRFEDSKVLGKSLAHIPRHWAGQPEEIAKAILSSSSDDADDVTGHTLVVDGGLRMQRGGA